MKAFLAAFVALWMVQGMAFSQKAPVSQKDALEKTRAQQAAVLDQQQTQIAQVEAEHAQAVKDYPAWLVKAVDAEFAAVLDAGNRYLAAPSQKNLELFQAAKIEQLQRAGVHICKFADASQCIVEAERDRLGEQLSGMMDAFTKNEKALEVRIDGVIAQQQRQQAMAQGEMPCGDAPLKK